jgi:hypothetical protein
MLKASYSYRNGTSDSHIVQTKYNKRDIIVRANLQFLMKRFVEDVEFMLLKMQVEQTMIFLQSL